MEMNEKFAGVVILYKPENTVIDNIMSYIEFFDKLFIVDNTDVCSKKTKSIIDTIKKLPNTEYISLGGNFGIAKAMNVAFEQAIKLGFLWCLTLDQDSKFKTNILSIYQNYLNENLCLLPKVALLTPEYVFARRKSKPLLYNKSVKLTMQSASLFNLEIFKKYGPFREDFFLDCVDYDYCCKLKKNNFLIIQCAGALLLHNPGITKVAKIFGFHYNYGYIAPIRLYYQTRNLLQLFKEYHSLFFLILIFWKFLKICFFFEKKKEHFIAMQEAFYDFKKKKFGKKIQIQK